MHGVRSVSTRRSRSLSPLLLCAALLQVAASAVMAAGLTNTTTLSASVSASASATLSASASASATASASESVSASASASESLTETLTLPTGTDTHTDTQSASETLTLSLPTATATLSATHSESSTDSLTLPTGTDSLTASHTASASETATRSASLSASRTSSRTATQTSSETGTVTLPTETATHTPSATASQTETVTLPTDTATQTPSETASETATLTLPTETASATASATVSETETLTLPTATETRTPSETASGTATESETVTESETFSTSVFPVPVLTGLRADGCQAYTSGAVFTLVCRREAASGGLTLTLVGSQFPHTKEKVTSIVFAAADEEAAASVPSCAVSSLTYTGVEDTLACALNVSESGGAYTVALSAYEGALSSSGGGVRLEVATLWGADVNTGAEEEFWPRTSRMGTVYAPTTVTFPLGLAGVVNNDRVFLVTAVASGCASAQSRLNQTEATVVVAASGVAIAVLDTAGLPVGDYLLCHEAMGLGLVMQRRFPVHLSGPLDPHRSVVCCTNNTMAVGSDTTCAVQAVDDAGEPTGASVDECHFGFSHLRDGAGAALCAASIRPAKTSTAGEFTFSFVSYASGCAGRVGVTYRGVLLGGKVAMLTFRPGPAHPGHATSECETDAASGALGCRVTKRDLHHNPTEVCSTYYGTNPSPVHCEPVG